MINDSLIEQTDEETYTVEVKGCGVAILKEMSKEHARRIINLMMTLSQETAQ